MDHPVARPGALDPLALQLLAHLHRGGAWAYWWVADEARRDERGRPQTRSFWWPTSRPPLPLPVGERVNIYMGVHPCRVRRGDNQRATLPTVAAINCLYAEFDVAPHETKLALLERVKRLSPAPSVIMDSGGYHAYWLLEEPFVLEGEAERERARQAQYRWVEFTGADPAAKDLARVLRVPGTVNRKPAYAPTYPAVTILQADFERTYTLAELEQVAAAALPAQPRQLPGLDGEDAPADHERAARARARLQTRRCDTYDDWLHVGMALHAGLGEAGLALWERWSQQSEKYEPGICAAKWRSFAQRPHGYSLASLFYWAEQDDPTTGASRASSAPAGASAPGEPPAEDDDGTVAVHLTDLGNARRLGARFGADLRYVAEWGWMVWDGRRWVQDRTGAVMRMAKATVLAITAEARDVVDEKVAEKIRSWARASEGRGRLEALIALAQADWLLTCRNGTLDLRTGEMRPHQRDDLRDDGRGDEPPPRGPEPGSAGGAAEHDAEAYAPRALLDEALEEELGDVSPSSIATPFDEPVYPSTCQTPMVEGRPKRHLPSYGGSESGAEPVDNSRRGHLAETPPRTTGPPGVDLAYVRRLLNLGDAESLAALERHCALYNVSRAAAVAAAYEQEPQINQSPQGKEPGDE